MRRYYIFMIYPQGDNTMQNPAAVMAGVHQKHTQHELFDDDWPGFDEPYMIYD